MYSSGAAHPSVLSRVEDSNGLPGGSYALRSVPQTAISHARVKLPGGRGREGGRASVREVTVAASPNFRALMRRSRSLSVYTLDNPSRAV